MIGKSQMAEFLFKRITKKLDDVCNASDHGALTTSVEDIEEYLSVLKEITVELIKP